MHDNSAAIINRRLIYGNEKWVTPTDSGCHRWRHVWSRTALQHHSSLRLLLEATKSTSAAATHHSVARSSFLLVVGGLFSHSVNSHPMSSSIPCIQPFVRIRSRCTRCTRTAAGCFTDSTIATGYSTIGVSDRFHSDFTVSLSWEFSTDYKLYNRIEKMRPGTFANFAVLRFWNFENALIVAIRNKIIASRESTQHPLFVEKRKTKLRSFSFSCYFCCSFALLPFTIYNFCVYSSLQSCYSMMYISISLNIANMLWLRLKIGTYNLALSSKFSGNLLCRITFRYYFPLF